ERLRVHVADHSRDRPCAVRWTDETQDPPAQRLTLCEIRPDESLVDEDHVEGAVDVGPGHVAAAQERNSDRLQIAGRRPGDSGLGVLPGRSLVPALGNEAEL